jgi:hypothetical protein
VRAANVHAAGELRLMTIELTTRAAAHALADYLERCGCTVDFVSELVLEIAPPGRSQTARDATTEMEAYLSVWRAMYPMHGVTQLPAVE